MCAPNSPSWLVVRMLISIYTYTHRHIITRAPSVRGHRIMTSCRPSLRGRRDAARHAGQGPFIPRRQPRKPRNRWRPQSSMAPHHPRVLQRCCNGFIIDSDLIAHTRGAQDLLLTSQALAVRSLLFQVRYQGPVTGKAWRGADPLALIPESAVLIVASKSSHAEECRISHALLSYPTGPGPTAAHLAPSTAPLRVQEPSAIQISGTKWLRLSSFKPPCHSIAVAAIN